jgi:hypothetical protein
MNLEIQLKQANLFETEPQEAPQAQAASSNKIADLARKLNPQNQNYD